MIHIKNQTKLFGEVIWSVNPQWIYLSKRMRRIFHLHVTILNDEPVVFVCDPVRYAVIPRPEGPGILAVHLSSTQVTHGLEKHI